MDNKLVFEPTTLTQYNWNKYQLIENRTYKWDKYEAVPEYLYTYYWNKYEAVPPGLTNEWDVYNINNVFEYEYDEDLLLQIWQEASYSTWQLRNYDKRQHLRVVRNANSIMNDSGSYTFDILGYGPDNRNTAYVSVVKQFKGAYLSLRDISYWPVPNTRYGRNVYLAKSLVDITQMNNLIRLKEDITYNHTLEESNNLLKEYIMDGYKYVFYSEKQYYPYGEDISASHIYNGGYGYDSYENGLLYGFSFKANELSHLYYKNNINPEADYHYPNNEYLYTAFNHLKSSSLTTTLPGDFDIDFMASHLGRGTNQRGMAPLSFLSPIMILNPGCRINFNADDRVYYVVDATHSGGELKGSNLVITPGLSYTQYSNVKTQPDSSVIYPIYNGWDESDGWFIPYVSSDVISPSTLNGGTIGSFYGKIYNTDISAYPQNGSYNNKWYFYVGETTLDDYSPGDLIETVNTHNPNSYPTDGRVDNYYYIYQYSTRIILNWVKDRYIGQITSPTNSYPSNSFYPNNYEETTHYWYSFLGYDSQFSRGNFIERVHSYIESAYPQDSYILNDCWYSYVDNEIQIVGQLVIDNSLLMGGVNYTQEINPSEDLMIGTPGAAQVDFTIFAPDASAATQYLGKDFVYYVKMNSDNDWRQIGTFTLTKAELPDKQTAKIQGFDYIYKFDTIIDEWLDEQTFPMTLGNMFASLCEYVGCEAYSTDFTNSDFQVNDNFEAVQITGRTILQYITEASGGFCVAEPDGRIHLKHYAIPPTGAVNLGNNSYRKYTHEIYNVPVISSVVVRKDDDDEGVESNV